MIIVFNYPIEFILAEKPQTIKWTSTKKTSIPFLGKDLLLNIITDKVLILKIYSCQPTVILVQNRLDRYNNYGSTGK